MQIFTLKAFDIVRFFIQQKKKYEEMQHLTLQTDPLTNKWYKCMVLLQNTGKASYENKSKRGTLRGSTIRKWKQWISLSEKGKSW